MKKLYTLFGLMCFSVLFVQAQLHETEVNDSISVANKLPMDSSISGSTCEFIDPDFFQIVTSADGMVRIISQASVTTSTVPGQGGLSITLLSKTGQTLNTYSPRVGVNSVDLIDTFYTCCLAQDTFYIQMYRGWAFTECWNYTISCHLLLPTYTNDAEPNHQAQGVSIPMAYNTPTDGHLGFNHEPNGGSDQDDFFQIILPTDGTLKLHVKVEAESSPSHVLNIGLFNSSNAPLYNQSATTGSFLAPTDTFLYWECLVGDTMYINPTINTFGDAGYSYQLSYTVIPPVFNNDIEPNSSFVTAQIINPNLPVEGHLDFYNHTDDDYFRFYKPDTGFLMVVISAEAPGVANPTTFDFSLYDSLQNQYPTIYPPIGANGQPAADTMYFASVAPGLYYLKVYNALFGATCISYKFTITTPTISGTTGINATTATQALNIFPNPSSGTFTIDFGDAKNATVNLYNMMGELVETTGQRNDRYVVLGEKLSSGLYLIKAVDETGTTISQGKLVKTN